MKKGDWVAVDDWDDVEHYTYVIQEIDENHYKLHCPDILTDGRNYKWMPKDKVRLMTDEELALHKGVIDE